MATEDIKIEGKRICVERFGTKQNVDVAASDVDSVTFTRSVWDGPGALILHTSNQGDVVIRVENEDADEVLDKVRPLIKNETAAQLPAPYADVPESNEENDENVEAQTTARKARSTK